ncbi:MAG: peptide chain release factor N(5)-glutamine methyltransferase [Chloroflexota bacterium]
MTLREALRQARETLTRNNIDDAHLEAELLLRHVLGLTRAKFFARLTEELPLDRQSSFLQIMGRRLNHEPTAYITGHKEFFGLDFHVDRRVLIPRPETELMVEKALEFARTRFSESCLVADIGTGSGAVAVSLAVHLSQATIFATDVSNDALEVAALNCRRHGVESRVKLLPGDTVSPLPEPVHIMTANLPYVTDGDLAELAPEVRCWEPLQALAGGRDGLDTTRDFLSKASHHIRPDGVILMEMNPEQREALGEIAQHNFARARMEVARDLAGLDRLLILGLGTS